MEGTTPVVRHNGADTIEVEVITFDHEFAPLDRAGETLFGKGAKGHTCLLRCDCGGAERNPRRQSREGSQPHQSA